MSEHKVFDRESALERLDDDEDLLAELIQIFFEDFPAYQQVLTGAESSSNELMAAAHSLKSALGNIGAMQGFEAARSLEDDLRSQGRTETTALQVKRLLSAVDEFLLAAGKIS